MTIEERLVVEQTAAMKGGDRPTLNVIRQIRSEVSMARSAPGFTGEVDDQLYLSTISTYVKRMGKSKTEYEALGERGREQAEKLAFEIDYLSKYVPMKLDEAATRDLVDQVIEDLGAFDPKMTGQVIGQVMKSGQDVDGGLVARLVNEALNQ